MIRLAGWQKFWFERDAHKQTKEAYASMRASYAVASRTLDEANRREAELRAQVADLTLQLECLTCDVTDREREIEALTNGLTWFEGSGA